MIRHFAYGLLLQRGDLKLYALQRKDFTGVAIDAIAALLGLLAVNHGGDQLGMADQPVDFTGFFRISVHGCRYWLKGVSDRLP